MIWFAVRFFAQLLVVDDLVLHQSAEIIIVKKGKMKAENIAKEVDKSK